MHVIGLQMTFKLLIWPLTTLYDLCSLFQHQNRVHWPRKWLERCVTLIYSDVIYSPYDRFYQNGGHLGFQPPQPLAQGGKSRKVDFYEGKISVSDVWKNQLSPFFFQVKMYSSWAIGKIIMFEKLWFWWVKGPFKRGPERPYGALKG